MGEKEDSIIGVGWAFPPRFDLNRRTVVTVTGEEDIIQSLTILFGTQRGERILERDYGCDLHARLFRPLSSAETAMLENQIRRAIIQYESRITLDKVQIDASQSADGRIDVLVEFTIASTNNRRNIVFPFYGTEGSLIPKT